MKLNTSAFVKLSTWALPYFLFASVAHANTMLYSGEPEINKLIPAIQNTTLFAAAPKPTEKQSLLLSRFANNNLPYSQYLIQPLQTLGTTSKYKTTETIENGSIFPGIQPGSPLVVNGRGISLGGIFWPLEKMSANNAQGQQVYYNVINIHGFKYISGSLFPLKVGNDLKFHFDRTHQQIVGGTETLVNDSGVMEYKVVGQYQGYPKSKNTVPGLIYTIEVWEKTNLHPNKYLTDIYDYSLALGWYVTDRYYNTDNQHLMTYHLGSWE